MRMRELPKRIKVTVTKRHWKMAEKSLNFVDFKRESECPVARAIKQTAPRSASVAVGISTAKIGALEGDVIYQLPKRLEKAVDAFDSNGEVELPLTATIRRLG